MEVITVSGLWNIVSEIFRNLISQVTVVYVLHSVCVLGSALDWEDGIYNILDVGASLVVEWLRLHILCAGGLHSILGQGTGSTCCNYRTCMLQWRSKGPSAATKIQSSQINKNKNKKIKYVGSILRKFIIKSWLTLNIQSLHRNFLCSNFFYIKIFGMNNTFMFSKVKMIKLMLRRLASAHTCHFYSCLHLRGKFLLIINVSV